jgi:hypothetical protein
MTMLGVDSRAGLTAGEARRRLTEYGPNELEDRVGCRSLGEVAGSGSSPRTGLFMRGRRNRDGGDGLETPERQNQEVEVYELDSRLRVRDRPGR